MGRNASARSTRSAARWPDRPARGARRPAAPVRTFVVSKRYEQKTPDFGKSFIDICINCAGVVSGREFTGLTDEQLVRTFQVNALAPFRTTRVVLPGMLARDRGVLVNIASAAGLTGVAKLSDYSAAKSAVAGFTESLRAELRDRGSSLRTLVVYPYYIDTGMFAGVRARVPALLPVLDRHRVAHRIVDAIESGRQQLFLPGLVAAALAIRMLPVPVSRVVFGRLGVHRAMAGFVGRQTI